MIIGRTQIDRIDSSRLRRDHLRIEGREILADRTICVQSLPICIQTGLDIGPVCLRINGRRLDLGEIDRVRILIPRRHVDKATRQRAAISFFRAILLNIRILRGMSKGNDAIRRIIRRRADRCILTDDNGIRHFHIRICPDSDRIIRACRDTAPIAESHRIFRSCIAGRTECHRIFLADIAGCTKRQTVRPRIRCRRICPEGNSITGFRRRGIPQRHRIISGRLC